MSNNKFKVLVVEDEANICSFIETLLETNGYQALVANTCAMGQTLFTSHNPDLIILDLGLPDRDGLELIRFVRQKFLTPIVVLSARTTEQDKIEALDLGANDYITKPFGTGELLARVRAALRTNRFGVLGGMPGGVFRAQGLEINYERRKVFVDGAEIKLTQTEYNIVAFLSEHAGRVMTYAAIVRAIWGDTDCGSTKKLQVNMANIRKKLGSVPGQHLYSERTGRGIPDDRRGHRCQARKLRTAYASCTDHFSADLSSDAGPAAVPAFCRAGRGRSVSGSGRGGPVGLYPDGCRPGRGLQCPADDGGYHGHGLPLY